MRQFNGFDVHISPPVFGTFCLFVGVLVLYVIWRAANASSRRSSVSVIKAPDTRAIKDVVQIESFFVAQFVMRMSPDVDSELKRMRAALECRGVSKKEIDRVVALAMMHIQRDECGCLQVRRPTNPSENATT